MKDNKDNKDNNTVTQYLAALSLMIFVGMIPFSVMRNDRLVYAQSKAKTPALKRVVPAPAPVVVPAGVQVVMSDGTTQTYGLGTWLAFQTGLLRVYPPTQYVNQLALYQATTNNWKVNRAGRNIQIWVNGLMYMPYQGANAIMACPVVNNINTLDPLPINYLVVTNPDNTKSVQFTTYTINPDGSPNAIRVDPPGSKPLTAIRVGDYFVAGQMITPRVTDPDGIPAYNCDGQFFSYWSQDSMVVSAYLY